MNLLSELGCPTVVERGRRVFPASQKASDVTKALTRALAAADIRLNTHVTGITVQDGICTGVLLGNSQAIASDAVVVATGGVSYRSQVPPAMDILMRRHWGIRCRLHCPVWSPWKLLTPGPGSCRD